MVLIFPGTRNYQDRDPDNSGYPEISGPGPDVVLIIPGTRKYQDIKPDNSGYPELSGPRGPDSVLMIPGTDPEISGRGPDVHMRYAGPDNSGYPEISGPRGPDASGYPELSGREQHTWQGLPSDLVAATHQRNDTVNCVERSLSAFFPRCVATSARPHPCPSVGLSMVRARTHRVL